MERLKGEVWRTVWGLGFLVVLPVKSKSLRPVSRTFRSLRFDQILNPREACAGTSETDSGARQRSESPKYSFQLAIFPPTRWTRIASGVVLLFLSLFRV